MRITLTSTQSQQWLRGDPDALAVEQEVIHWAQAHQVDEPVVAVLSTGQRAFAFRLPVEGEEP